MIANLFQNTILGIPIGCVFALLAVGLVLTFKTSGVFNLAFAAQAYAASTIYYVLRKQHEWPLLLAAFVSIVVLGVAMAVVLDRAMYRYQRTASPLAKMVTSLGLLIAVPQLVQVFFGSSLKNPPPLWTVKRADQFVLFDHTPFVLDANQVATIVCTVLVAIGLSVLFARTALGLRMRAAVESPRLLQLQGVDAERVSLTSSVISSMLAGLAGVLIAPLYLEVSSLDFFALLISAVAAAVAARMTSIPVAMLTGIGLGVAQAQLAALLPSDSVLSTGLRPSLPFLVLFALLVFQQAHRRTPNSDPMAGVDPPTSSAASRERMGVHLRARTTAMLVTAVAVVGLIAALAVLDDYWLRLLASGMCVAVILLSIVLTAGIGRTISLCQGSLAATGAFTTGILVSHDVPALVAIFAGAAVAAAVAAAIAVPVIRLPGIFAALATLAFAMMFESVIVPISAITGGTTPHRVPRPTVLGYAFDTNGSFLVLATAFVAIVGLAVLAIKHGFTGRFLDAVGASERGAASIGIEGARLKFVVFVVGGAIAGLGGGLLVSFTRSTTYDGNFTFFLSLVWVAVVATLGTRRVAAAVVGGLAFFVVPEVLNRLLTLPADWLETHQRAPSWVKSIIGVLDPRYAVAVSFVLFGLGALAYAKRPEGVIEAQSDALLGRFRRRPGEPAPKADRPDSGSDDRDAEPRMVVA